MTDNQAKQLMKLMNNCISGITELREEQKDMKSDISDMKSDISDMKSDISDMKSDISELKDGQRRIENKLDLNERATNTLAGEQVRIKERLADLEQPQA